MTEASVDTDDRSQHGRSHPAAKIPGWPVKPMRLQVFDASTIWSIVADVAMLLLSVAFSGTRLYEPSHGFHNFHLYILSLPGGYLLPSSLSH
jgi:hypothetical protein